MLTAEDELLYLCLFFTILGYCTYGSKFLHVHPLLLYLLIGSLCAYLHTDAVQVPPLSTYAGLRSLGYLGILLAILDAGLETSMSTLRAHGLRAFAVAFFGVLFPLLLALGYATVVVGADWKIGFTVGCSIAPTSLAFTLQLLATGTPFAQLNDLICIAAVFDDVISLVLLSEVTLFASSNTVNAMDVVKPVLFSMAFVAGNVLLLMILLPRLLPHDLPHTATIALIIVAALLNVFAATQAASSVLLAVYLVGISFAKSAPPNTARPWSPFVPALSVLFFTATVGFLIPLDTLFVARSLVRGLVVGTIAVVGKLACVVGLAGMKITLPDVAYVAFGMMGRGEFGFLILIMARQGGILADDWYVATLWGILIPIVLTPFILPVVARMKTRRQAQTDSGSDSESQQQTAVDARAGAGEEGVV